ncbi:response regulator transcription factor [Streptomyces monticola]|uniref:Response regulator transcription factor n=1 Tax=Streptomyces monticola TaxID=2666263 RepID=A0ABW2JRQ2_9ACTN
MNQTPPSPSSRRSPGDRPGPPTDGPLVLVAVADERALPVIGGLLEREGYRVHRAADGSATLRALRELRPDALLLGLRLPGGDAWKLLARARAMSDLPIILLDQVYVADAAARAYREGADDYLTYATPAAEALPRLAVRLRRMGTPARQAAVLDDGWLTVDLTARIVMVGGRQVPLAPLEFELLHAFARHPGQVLGHAQLLRIGWDDAAEGDVSRVKYALRRLRRSIEAATGQKVPVVAVRGIGYRYEPPRVM